MVTNRKQFAWLMALLVVVPGLGCASAYHRYSDCGVNCQYCEPAPLRYPHYPACGCHSKPGARYLYTPAAHRAAESLSDKNHLNSALFDQSMEHTESDQPILPVNLESSIDISQRPYDD